MQRRALVLFAAAMAMLCLTVGVAGAATVNVKTAIKQQDRIIQKNPEFKGLTNFKVTTKAQAEKAIPKLKSLQKAMDHAAAVVSKASTANADQKLGQKDWVAAARKVATGVGDLGTTLNDLVKGHTAAAKTELAKALKAIAAGDKLGLKADQLLGLKKGA